MADLLTRRDALAAAIQHETGPITAQLAARLNAAAGFSRHRNTARKDLRALVARGVLFPRLDGGRHTYTRTETTAMPTQIPSEVAAHVLFAANRGGYPAGTFTTKLLDAWNSADYVNNARLTDAFPEYGAALELLQQPGGIETLRRLAGDEAV